MRWASRADFHLLGLCGYLFLVCFYVESPPSVGPLQYNGCWVITLDERFARLFDSPQGLRLGELRRHQGGCFGVPFALHCQGSLGSVVHMDL